MKSFQGCTLTTFFVVIIPPESRKLIDTIITWVLLEVLLIINETLPEKEHEHLYLTYFHL